eukprot:1444878-Rhodomonas_salina.5
MQRQYPDIYSTKSSHRLPQYRTSHSARGGSQSQTVHQYPRAKCARAGRSQTVPGTRASAAAPARCTWCRPHC